MNRQEIVTAFQNVLDESKIAYKVDSRIRPGSIVIRFGVKSDSETGRLWAIFEFKGACIRIYGVAPDLASVKDSSELFKLLAMINYDTVPGCFEFEMKSKQIRFRYFIDCDGFATVSRNFICNILWLPFQMFYRYGASFVALVEGFPEASIAFGMARIFNED